MVNLFKEKRSVFLGCYPPKTSQVIATIPLVIGFLFVVACGEASTSTDSLIGGSSDYLGDSGAGGSGGFQTTDTGIPPLSPASGGSGGIAVMGGSGGSSGTGGIPVTGGTGGTSGLDATVIAPPDSGLGDGDVIDSADAGAPDSTLVSETGTQTDSGLPPGSCCADGNCICRDEPPASLTSEDGPYHSDSYTVQAGCIYYPTDADPPFSAVTVADGFLGSGGCSSFQTGRWGPLYASWGIVAMIVNTGSADQPAQRGDALLRGIEAFKAENNDSNSPLYQMLAGRYSTSGFSMGGGGTTYASQDDPSLLSSVALMAWGPVTSGVTVPTIFVCGSSDGTAPCSSHGSRAYAGIAEPTPKMIVTVRSGHSGQPTSGSGMEGAWGLAFQKLYLDGDERWKSVLLSGDYDDTNIQ